MNSSHATKSCVLILLVALLYAERAQGLKCHQYVEVPLGTSCPSVTCHDQDVFCIFLEIEHIVYSHRRKVKNKLCLPICPLNLENPGFLGIVLNVTTSCCKKNLCNAEVPTGGSAWTMAGVLLFSLSSVLLQTLL